MANKIVNAYNSFCLSISHYEMTDKTSNRTVCSRVFVYVLQYIYYIFVSAFCIRLYACVPIFLRLSIQNVMHMFFFVSSFGVCVVFLLLHLFLVLLLFFFLMCAFLFVDQRTKHTQNCFVRCGPKTYVLLSVLPDSVCSAMDSTARSVCMYTCIIYEDKRRIVHKILRFVHSHLNTLTHTHINTLIHTRTTHSAIQYTHISHEIIPMSTASTEGTRCHQHRRRNMVTLILLIEIEYSACVDIDSFLCCCMAITRQ